MEFTDAVSTADPNWTKASFEDKAALFQNITDANPVCFFDSFIGRIVPLAVVKDLSYFLQNIGVAGAYEQVRGGGTRPQLIVGLRVDPTATYDDIIRARNFRGTLREFFRRKGLIVNHNHPLMRGANGSIHPIESLVLY